MTVECQTVLHTTFQASELLEIVRAALPLLSPNQQSQR